MAQLWHLAKYLIYGSSQPSDSADDDDAIGQESSGVLTVSVLYLAVGALLLCANSLASRFNGYDAAKRDRELREERQNQRLWQKQFLISQQQEQYKEEEEEEEEEAGIWHDTQSISEDDKYYDDRCSIFDGESYYDIEDIPNRGRTQRSSFPSCIC